MEPTCVHYTPSTQSIMETGGALAVSPQWPFDVPLQDVDACTSPDMHGQDSPVPCQFRRNQSQCPFYTAQPQKILIAYRQERTNPTFGAGRFLLLALVEDRYGAGIRSLTINQVESHDPLGANDVNALDLERLLSTEHPNDLDIVANAHFASYMVDGNWQRAPELETHIEHSGYFAHVLALAAQD